MITLSLPPPQAGVLMSGRRIEWARAGKACRLGLGQSQFSNISAKLLKLKQIKTRRCEIDFHRITILSRYVSIIVVNYYKYVAETVLIRPTFVRPLSDLRFASLLPLYSVLTR